MDISLYPAAADTTPPPPSYDEVQALAVYDDLSTKPPPPYTDVTAPPPGINQQQATRFLTRPQAAQFPVLNMPGVEAVNYREQVFVHQQFVRNDTPQVIVVQPQQIVISTLGDTPTATVCKYCQNSILTVVEYKPGCAAWAMCILLAVLGLICGFCLIPFCVRGFQDAHHSCPRCRRHLGIYKRK